MCSSLVNSPPRACQAQVRLETRSAFTWGALGLALPGGMVRFSRVLARFLIASTLPQGVGY